MPGPSKNELANLYKNRAPIGKRHKQYPTLERILMLFIFAAVRFWYNNLFDPADL